MRFFFDRNMSKRLARAINALDNNHTIVAHDDDGRFQPTTTDTEWIGVLAKDDPPWAVLSGDGGILKNKIELKALREARLTFFCLSSAWQQMKIHEVSWRLIRAWPDIVEAASQNPDKPQVYEITGVKSTKIARYYF